VIRGSNFAQISKCSKCDKNIDIVSVLSSLFRRYIYFLKRSPYGEDIAICSLSQTGKKFDDDCTCPYSLYGLTWQDHTDLTMMTWHILISGLLVSRVLTRVLGWPMVGGHVAQSVGATCPSLVG
jgi:hypothetical protein